MKWATAMGLETFNGRLQLIGIAHGVAYGPMEWANVMGRASQRSIEKNTVIGRKSQRGLLWAMKSQWPTEWVLRSGL